MSEKLLILGAGGNSIGIIDAIEAAGPQASFQIAGFLDDLPENRGREVLGYPVLGRIEDAGRFTDCRLVNGISSVESFRKREAIVARTGAGPERFATVVHPSAVISARAQVGRGCVVLANSVVCPEAALEDHVLILQGSTVNHHARVGAHATLSAGVTLLGSVEIGRSGFVGGGASVAPYVKIGAGALVGMGSVVIRDLPPGRVAAGNPARELEASKYRRDGD
jgi:sugar O-acyltransferase (sialic acid O-acetyltransferase NeuD family)